MANKDDDYLTNYREFFERFSKLMDPNDQLPVRLGNYRLLNCEVVGGIIDWTSQYLTQKTKIKMNLNEWHPDPTLLNTIKNVLQEALIPESEIQRTVHEKMSMIQAIPDFMFYLFYILENPSYPEDVRSLSGILAKNHFPIAFPKLNQDDFRKIKQECLNLLMDPLREVRLSASGIIASIARDHLMSWPELVPCLLTTFTADNSYSQVALSTLFKICEDMVHIQKSHEEIYGLTKEVFPKFVEYLTRDYNPIHIEIIKLMNRFIQDYYYIVKQSLDLSAYLAKVIRLAVIDDVELQRYICHAFVVYVERQEECLLPHLHDVIRYLIEKYQNEDLELAREACEFWLATAKLPTGRDILAPYMDKLLPLILKNMRYSSKELQILKDCLGADAHTKDLSQDIAPFHLVREKNCGDDYIDDEDDDEMQNGDYDDYYMGWTLRKCSAASLDIMSLKFGDELLNMLIPYISEMIKHSDYLVRESAILALGAIAEGCSNGLKPQLPEIMNFLQSSMNDKHSVVRVISCWTIGRYVTWIVNVKPDEPQLYFVPVMLLLMKHFQDENKRVQRAALSAFCVFEEAAQGQLIPYVGIILENLVVPFEMLQSRSLYLLYDAVQVLAHCVGNQLSDVEYVAKLVPPLLKKFAESDHFTDDHLVAVMECLASVIPALELSFLPYAEGVFNHCIRLINDTLEACVHYQEYPHEYDPPDKDTMTTAHEVLFSMAQGLKSYFVKLSMDSSLLTVLFTTIQDSCNLIRQNAIATIGEMVYWAYPFLVASIADFMPLIIANLDEHNDGVCTSAAWAIYKFSSAMGYDMEQFAPEIIQHFVHIIREPSMARTMHQTVALSLCAIFLVSPNIEIVDPATVIKNCCMLVRNARDSKEKELAFRGLCVVINRYPEVIGTVLIYFCDAAASWCAIRPELKETITNLLVSVKTPQATQNNTWASVYPQFPDNLKVRLFDLYGV